MGQDIWNEVGRRTAWVFSLLTYQYILSKHCSHSFAKYISQEPKVNEILVTKMSCI